MLIGRELRELQCDRTRGVWRVDLGWVNARRFTNQRGGKIVMKLANQTLRAGLRSRGRSLRLICLKSLAS